MALEASMENKLDDLKVPDVIRAPRTDPIYNCHAYLTKVPVAAILPFVQQFTRPGDVVLDPFAGSGMTGLAAAMEGVARSSSTSRSSANTSLKGTSWR